MTAGSRHLTDAEAQRLVDGALSEGDAPGLARHAEACPACAANVAGWRALAEALEDLPRPELPRGFTEGVLALVDSRERAAARERRHAALILGGVGAAALAAFALAGAAAWAPLVSSAAGLVARSVFALRIGWAFVPDVVGALRLQIVVVAAAVAIPLLLALARLVPSPRTENAPS